MKKISSPIPILEFGSTYIRLAVYEKNILNQNLYYEKKTDFTRGNHIDEESISELIVKAEKDIDQHLNEIQLILDSPNIHTLDLSIKKNFENKTVTKNDINHLISECEQIVKTFNKQKDILHVLTSNIIFDNKIVNSFEDISKKAQDVILQLKFIMINKIDINHIKNLLLKKHISLKNIFCSSYIKSFGLINKLEIYNYISFIDIGFKKSSLSIFKDTKLLYLNYINIGGDSITKDISKILNFNYRTAEAKKLKFSKINKSENHIEEQNLLKKIINARLEEIVELLFINCPLLKNNTFDSNLKLYFIGSGSKVLNENLLSFGSEFSFINEMSIIDEDPKDCFQSALKFLNKNEKMQPHNDKINFENPGFFEKFFEYFSSK